MEDQTIIANRRQQAELYGRPLGDIIRDLTGALHLSQARLAEVLGMSAPMLSQLASARRVKIGNPQAVARLQSLLELAAVAASIPPARLTEHVNQIAATSATITSTSTSPLAMQLRAIGNPAALLAAAEASEVHAPALAEVLRQAASHA